MMPLKPFSVLLFCHVWITVMLCLLVLQNTSLKNSSKFRIMLLDSSSVAPNLIMSPLSFIACTGSLSIWESTTRFLLSVSKFWNQLRPLTSLISYMFTLPPGNFVLHLMIDFSVFLTSEQSRMVNALLLIRELTPGTSSHSLFGIRSL